MNQKLLESWRGEEADPQAPLDEEMDVDSEEEGHRSDIELSLSDSD